MSSRRAEDVPTVKGRTDPGEGIGLVGDFNDFSRSFLIQYQGEHPIIRTYEAVVICLNHNRPATPPYSGINNDEMNRPPGKEIVGRIDLVGPA